MIATDCGGPREMISHGDNGYLVARNSSDQLADYLRVLARRPALRQSMGAASKERARIFTPEYAVAQFERLFVLAIQNYRSADTAPESRVKSATQEMGARLLS